MGRKFTGFEHQHTGKRFRLFEKAKKFAIVWGKKAGSGPNDVWQFEKDVHTETYPMPWK